MLMSNTGNQLNSKANVDMNTTWWHPFLALPQVNKFLPPHRRKKVSSAPEGLQAQQPLPVMFEMIPSSGMLSPGEQGYVQIKFSPAEGVKSLNSFQNLSECWADQQGLPEFWTHIKPTISGWPSVPVHLQCPYSIQLVLRVAESKHEVSLTAEGLGVEPYLEFSTSELELGPCQPFTTDVEAEVTIRNPCSFPIEFYSLELDTQYIKEEKVALIVFVISIYPDKKNKVPKNLVLKK